GGVVGEAADARDAVEDEVDEKQERHVADELDVSRDERPQHSAAAGMDEGEGEPDDDADGDAGRRQLEAEEEAPAEPVETPPDQAEVEVIAHRRRISSPLAREEGAHAVDVGR